MITFDHNKISISVVRLKSITQALGGSISVVDEDRSANGKEIYKRISVPLAVARAFIQKHAKVTKYIKPVYTAVVMYDGYVISLERHPMGLMGELMSVGFDGEPVTWTPYSQTNLDKLVYPMMVNSGREWYFDGRYVYSFNTLDLDDVVDLATPMTKDMHFRKVASLAIDLQELSNVDKLQPQDRSCIAFVTDNFDYSISPPIWKDIESMGASRKDEAESKMPVSFDTMNETMAVNLNFALKAGKDIGTMFGYEWVEPLQLPRLMIELHTVNLPNIPKQVKATYCIGMKFTHAFAWLLGLLNKADTLETYIMMRSLMKYLTKRGIYRNGVFNANQIFVDGQTANDVPLLNLDELMEEQNFTALTMDNLINQAKSKQHKTETKNIGGLLVED